MAFQEKYNCCLTKFKDIVRCSNYPLFSACLGEFFGTYVLILMGLGIVLQNQFILHQQPTNIENDLSMGVGWFAAFVLGKVLSGQLSCSILNPACTLSLALVGKLPLKCVLPFSLSQFLAGILATFTLLTVYEENIQKYILYITNKKSYNSSTSIEYKIDVTAQLFIINNKHSHGYHFFNCMIISIISTVIVVSIKDDKKYELNKSYRSLYGALLTAGKIGALSLNGGTSINPASNLGPKIAVSVYCWSVQIFTKLNSYFWISIAGQYTGSAVGAILYNLVLDVNSKAAK